MAYEPPLCDNIIFMLDTFYEVPACDDISFYSDIQLIQIISQNIEYHLSLEISNISGGSANDLPYLTQRSFSFDWDIDTNNTKKEMDFNWEKWKYNEVSIIPKECSWGSSNNILHVLKETSYFKSDDVFSPLKGIHWEIYTEYLEKTISDNFVPKMDLLFFERSVIWNTWEYSELIRPEISSRYKIPPFVHEIHDFVWDMGFSIQHEFTFGYRISKLLPIDFSFLWGELWYSLLCEKIYFPSPGDLIRFKINEVVDFGVCHNIVLISAYEPNNYCPYKHKHTGFRDNYTIIPTPPSAPIISWSYCMVNTVLVKRLPDNTPIEVYSVSIQTDEDSYLWDFTVVIPDEYHLNLLKPVIESGNLVLKDIEININNNIWTCRIERWSESISFGQKSWTLHGRSPSCELSSPYNPVSSFENISDLQGGQLINSVLSDTDWSIEWGFDNDSSTYSDNFNPVINWLVPAGVFSLAENTKMQAIQHILEAIQASIITKPNCYTDKALIVVPRFRHKPWEWGTQPYEETIIPHICSEVGQDFISNEDVNLVIVSGEPGVTVKGTKTGTDGSKLGALFTHQLITSMESGHEACKNLMSKEGKWFERTFKFFSLDDGSVPTDLVPSLLLPTQLVRYTDGVSTWRGKVSSVSIEASMGSNGVEVYQSISVLNYIG